MPAIFSGTLTPAIQIVSSSIFASYSHVSVVIDSIQRVMSCIEAFVIIQGIMIHAITIQAMLILQQMFVIATHTVINKTKFALTDCGKITDFNVLFYYVWEIVLWILIFRAQTVYVYIYFRRAYFVIRVTNLKDALNYAENFRKYIQRRNFVLVEPFKSRFK